MFSEGLQGGGERNTAIIKSKSHPRCSQTSTCNLEFSATDIKDVPRLTHGNVQDRVSFGGGGGQIGFGLPPLGYAENSILHGYEAN